MKPCDPWRQELADCALGAPASAALAEHLEECPACSAALDKWQARVREIDTGIRQLAASEPSPNAAAHILAHVGSRQRRWLPRGRTIVAAFAALIILAVTVQGVLRLREARGEMEKALSAAAYISDWRSPTQNLLHSPYDAMHKDSPRLGEYFYELERDALKMKHYLPRAKETEKP
jgi:anti-sigma factor RsiW